MVHMPIVEVHYVHEKDLFPERWFVCTMVCMPIVEVHYVYEKDLFPGRWFVCLL